MVVEKKLKKQHSELTQNVQKLKSDNIQLTQQLTEKEKLKEQNEEKTDDIEQTKKDVQDTLD